MLKLVNALLIGVLGAGVVHIAILFLLPRYTEQNAWAQVSDLAAPYTPVRLDEAGDGSSLLHAVDPLFDSIVCRFDLSDGVVRVHAPGTVPFWSMSVYDRKGENIFSFNDRIATDGTLDFVILTPAQMIEMRKGIPPEYENSVFVEADVSEGMALVRSFVPDHTWSKVVADYLDGISCDLGLLG